MKNILTYSLPLLMGFLLVFGSSCNSSTAETKPVVTPKQPQLTAKPPQPPVSKTPSKIEWMTFEEVQKKMKKKPKKVFVDVYTHWCGPCKMMDRNTFAKDEIANYVNENFYAVKFNAQHEKPIKFNGNTYANPNYDPAKGQMRRNASHQLSGAMGVRAFPTIVFLNEKLELMQAVPGYKTPQQLQPMLEAFVKI